MNPCPHSIKAPVTELVGVPISTLGDFILKVENTGTGEQDQDSAFDREVREQENTHICQANRTINGR